MTYVYIIWHNKITKCEVIKKTEKIIIVNQELNNIIKIWHRTFRIKDGKVFDSWQEAHAALLAAAEQEVADARLYLERAKGHAGNIRGMKPPTEDAQP